MSFGSWTLDLEEFGRIHRARVTLAPLTVMVGRNNTGKTYLASLLWEILNPGRNLFPSPLRGDVYGECLEIGRSIVDGQLRQIGPAEWGVFFRCVNAVLDAKKEVVCEHITAFPGNTYKSSKIYFEDDCSYINPVVNAKEGGGALCQVGDEAINLTIGNEMPLHHASALSAGVMARTLLTGVWWWQTAYIPAARTGLMLSYRSLLREAFTQKINLPAPLAQFLADLSLAQPQSDKAVLEIAESLEQEILQGACQKTSGEVPEFLFRPDGTPLTLPLHATSSLVTELAPFIFLLRETSYNSIIFEEPEAHLHLEAQRVLARALVRLVNAGYRIILTTHSDTLLQQFNILMHLAVHPARDRLMEEFGYRRDEMLSPEMVRGYAFDGTPQGTVVREMEKLREGLVDPLMNDAIGTLSRQVLRLQEEDEACDDGL